MIVIPWCGRTRQMRRVRAYPRVEWRVGRLAADNCLNPLYGLVPHYSGGVVLGCITGESQIGIVHPTAVEERVGAHHERAV